MVHGPPPRPAPDPLVPQGAGNTAQMGGGKNWLWDGAGALLRGLVLDLGQLGGALSPEGLWRALAASGEARWAPTWPGMVETPGSSQGPTKSWACVFDGPPPFRSRPRLGLQERNFLVFPFLPNFGDSHAPGDVIAFLGEGHVTPRP